MSRREQKILLLFAFVDSIIIYLSLLLIGLNAAKSASCMMKVEFGWSANKIISSSLQIVLPNKKDGIMSVNKKNVRGFDSVSFLQWPKHITNMLIKDLSLHPDCITMTSTSRISH
jgi:hypothetical protein